MGYSISTREGLRRAPNTLGVQLGRLAVRLDFPVRYISEATGATRQTVYNWFVGADVSPAYHQRVKRLISILKAAPDADAARKQAWKHSTHEA
jgi:hypothetical protein